MLASQVRSRLKEVKTESFLFIRFYSTKCKSVTSETRKATELICTSKYVAIVWWRRKRFRKKTLNKNRYLVLSLDILHCTRDSSVKKVQTLHTLKFVLQHIFRTNDYHGQKPFLGMSWIALPIKKRELPGERAQFLFKANDLRALLCLSHMYL